MWRRVLDAIDGCCVLWRDDCESTRGAFNGLRDDLVIWGNVVVSRHFHSKAVLLQISRSSSLLSTQNPALMLYLVNVRLDFAHHGSQFPDAATIRTECLIIFSLPVAFPMCVFRILCRGPTADGRCRGQVLRAVAGAARLGSGGGVDRRRPRR